MAATADASAAAAAAAAAAGPPLFTNVIFHHVPNQVAPFLLAALVLTAACFGAMTLDLITNAYYDVRLARQPGWLDARKAGNRIAYYVCRYGALVYLLISLIYSTLPRLDCPTFGRSLGIVWIVQLLCVDALFVQRTMAVYGWDPIVAVPLGVLYVAYVGICAASVCEYGYGFQIPGSEFCAYALHPHPRVFTACIILGVVLDLVVLVLTSHRLLDGGLLNIFRLLRTDNATLRRIKAERKAIGEAVGEMSISGLMMRQGVGYFVVLVAARFAFMGVYYAVPTQATVQLMVASLMSAIGPLLAGTMFRQVLGHIKRRSGGSSAGFGGNSGDSDGSALPPLSGTSTLCSTMKRLPASVKALLPRTTAHRSGDDQHIIHGKQQDGSEYGTPMTQKRRLSESGDSVSHRVPTMAYQQAAAATEAETVRQQNEEDKMTTNGGGGGGLGLQIRVDETIDIEACTGRGPV